MGGQIGKLEMRITRNDLHKLSSLPIMLKEELEKALPRIGATIERTIKKHIQNQDLAWEHLTVDYIKWKDREGYSTDTWIMTSSMMNAVTWVVNKDNLSVFIGVNRTAGNHIETGKPLYEIAFALEFGTMDFKSKIPPRPLFQPSLEENKRSVETSVGIAIRRAFKTFEAGTVKV